MNEVTSQPRESLRALMSDLSEDAYCAAWHFDTEYRLWEILTGTRDGWMRLAGDDPRLAELRRLHEQTGGWWRWNPDLDDRWGGAEFVTTAAWDEIYARTVDDKDRHSVAIVEGKVLRGQEARDAVGKILGPSLKKATP